MAMPKKQSWDEYTTFYGGKFMRRISLLLTK